MLRNSKGLELTVSRSMMCLLIHTTLYGYLAFSKHTPCRFRVSPNHLGASAITVTINRCTRLKIE